MLDRARELDGADPLDGFRDRFTLPDGVIYLDGNSLGALPKAAVERVHQVVTGEWGEGLIRSWNASDLGVGWINLPQRIGAKIAPMIGARASEVIVADSVSANLFKLISAALTMRPGRKVILSELGNFPTDLYMIQGLQEQGLAEQRLAAREQIADAFDDDVALLLLTHVHYKSGAMHDMAALTNAAHEAGALVLWDLSHTGGAMPVDLNAVGADFAVGCGYKYLCGGPGAPAYAFVAGRHHETLSQPLSGWMGHARPFAFDDAYIPAPGVDRLLCGTPQVLSMSALEVGVDLIAEIGVDRLYAKSQALSEFFLECLSDRDIALELVSPSDSIRRGSQLSFRHENAYAICQALIARGVIGDFRDPDILRLGFAPAYLRFEDMAEAVRHLAEVLQTGEWQRDEFNQRAAVT
ncbi:MAG: kynureninase [Altererythrobacter sp. XM-24bin4]|jgi:kynureninase|uniref:kynureninase n=1 Tax=uncultured Altererythrobacter sp. TaxID=500840 RepID=UPI000D7AA4C4|nr:kynureninase [uncultured Altererythrobacter sp.]PWL25425.1 MAG: kynureninase [Altererythrobacter sp. XM-24bin4]